jgi:hypothetical protein
MQTKPIFIGFAAGILILVVAAASFSAGLYLGQRGYVADMRYQVPQNVQGGPPGNGMPSGNSPQSGPGAGGGPPGAPSWPPDVMGRLVSLTATAITLDSPQGIVTVALKADTKFIDETGNSISASEIQPGNVAAVFGRDAVMIIMRLPLRPNAP